VNCGFSSTTVPGRPGGSSVIRTAIRSVRQGLKRSRDDRTDSADTAEWVIFRFPSSKLRFPVRADVTTPAARSTVKLSVPTPPGVDHRVQLNPPELNPRGPRLPPGGGRPYLLLATRSSPTRLAAGVRGPPFGAAHRPSRLLFPVSPLSALSLATARRLRSVAGKTMLSTHPQSIHIRQPAVGIPVGLKVN